jgi:hypothetical protein
MSARWAFKRGTGATAACSRGAVLEERIESHRALRYGAKIVLLAVRRLNGLAF